jgi:hypothetical protein
MFQDDALVCDYVVDNNGVSDSLLLVPSTRTPAFRRPAADRLCRAKR